AKPQCPQHWLGGVAGRVEKRSVDPDLGHDRPTHGKHKHTSCVGARRRFADVTSSVVVLIDTHHCVLIVAIACDDTTDSGMAWSGKEKSTGDAQCVHHVPSANKEWPHRMVS